MLRDVRRAIQMQEIQKNNGIVIQQGGGLHILSPNTLLCGESHGRVIRLVTDTETLETYDKIAHFSFQLDKRFCICHKSYLVNMERNNIAVIIF